MLEGFSVPLQKYEHFVLLRAGVVTIAGGKLGRGGGHVDGPSEDAKFSDDFDLVYVGSSCSLLVVDRGNQAIREIQLQEDDCSQQEDNNLHLGKVQKIIFQNTKCVTNWDSNLRF